MKLNLFLLGAVVLLPKLLPAQTTETFEGITAASPNVKPTTFVSNGQSFTLTTDNCATGGIFGVWIPSQVYANCNTTNTTNNSVFNYGVGTSCTNGNCTGTSAQFIDDGGTNSIVLTAGHLYGIKTTNNAAFTVKSMFIYLSSNASTTPSDAGGLTITGKLAGTTVFTYTKTTGFNTGFAANNGFTYLDFSAGTNYTNSNIDELQIQSPNANYVALDNFTWGPNAPLPLGLLSFDLKQIGNSVHLNWKSSKEADVIQYQIEKSEDGKSFYLLDNVTVNNSGNYSFSDLAPLAGNNFYRLAIISKNETIVYSDVKSAFIADKTNRNGIIYPNPTTGNLFVKIPGTSVWNIQVTDLTGRVIIISKLSAENNNLDMTSVQNGTYLYKANDAATGAVVAQGKITKL